MTDLSRIAIFLTIFISSGSCFAQIGDVIRTGRPGQSFGPFTVGARILQFQGGVGYADSELENYEKRSSVYENLIIRYGIKEKVELSTALSFVSGTRENQFLNPSPVEKENFSGFSQVDVGYRIHFFERPSGFAASWQTRARLYILEMEELSNQKEIGYISTVSLGMPVGNSMITFNGGTSDTHPFLYVLNYSVNLTDSFITFVELYGSYNDEFYTAVDGGFAFLVNKDFQLDLYGGVDLEAGIKNLFIEGGFSYRIFSLR